MKDVNSAAWGRKQHLEREQLEQYVGPMNGHSSGPIEPAASEQHCKTIMDYWRKRGHPQVEAWPERIPSSQGNPGAIWVIRSRGIPLRGVRTC